MTSDSIKVLPMTPVFVPKSKAYQLTEVLRAERTERNIEFGSTRLLLGVGRLHDPDGQARRAEAEKHAAKQVSAADIGVGDTGLSILGCAGTDA
jgi:hypothetical protein